MTKQNRGLLIISMAVLLSIIPITMLSKPLFAKAMMSEYKICDNCGYLAMTVIECGHCGEFNPDYKETE